MARRLAAILATDVVGFSALMARDEAGTLERMIAFRKAVFDPNVTAHNGRVIRLMGDGALVEFASVVDAVACAIAIQTDAGDETDGLLRLRIGINLGDVIGHGGDVYGDGVNIAARLEALAEPGGICISGIVRESVGNRIDTAFADAGEQQLKNIETPVRVMHWRPGASPSTLATRTGAPPDSLRSDRPSIAVLAFDNMSTDPEQEYFSDGIAEDIITALSHFREFFVIARNSSFAYKGRSVNVPEVCRDLGVRYLLEGSTRKAGDRVRVTAQLIDGDTGAHLWAAKYDRKLDDIFAVQDEITRAIVSAVTPETMGAELKRLRRKRPENLSAWEKVLQARWHLAKFRAEDNNHARELLVEAVDAEPGLADAHATLAHCDLIGMVHLWREDPRAAIAAARDTAERAIKLDEQNAHAHAVLGMAECFARNFDDSERHFERAVSLNPNLATGYGNAAALYGVSGEYARATEAAEHAIALSPLDPLKAFWLGGKGIAAYVAGDYEACLANAARGLRDHPGYASLMRQETASLGMLGRTEEAAASVARLMEQIPTLTIAQVRHMVPIRYPDDHERWLEGLRRAGVPEG